MFYILSSVVGDVVETAQFITEAPQPEECFMYNTKLRVAHAEVGRRSIAVLAHEEFQRNCRCRAIVMQTPQEFCMARTLTDVEAYVVTGVCGLTFEELYRDAVQMSPDFPKLARNFLPRRRPSAPNDS
jgi:hypothetical protein